MTMTTGIKSKSQQSDLVICWHHLEPQTCVLTGPLLMFPLQPQPEEEDGDGEADMVSIALVSIAASSLQPPGTDTVLDKLTRFCNGERTLRNISAADGRCTMYRRHVQLYRYTHHQHTMQPSSQCRNSSLLSKCRFMTPNAFNLTVTRRASSRCHVCMSMSSMQLQSFLHAT